MTNATNIDVLGDQLQIIIDRAESLEARFAEVLALFCLSYEGKTHR